MTSRRARHRYVRTAGFGLCAMAAIVTWGAAPRATPQVLPERPRARVDTTAPVQHGRTIAVPGGGDFQGALNEAKPGDTITLQAGATYRGPFILPRKTGDGWIVIRTDAPDSRLPIPGARIDPSFARDLPKLVSSADPVLNTAAGAHHYRFVGLEIAPSPGASLQSVILLGGYAGGLADVPHHLVFDRCYIHGDPQRGSEHGLVMNSAQTAVIDSYLSDFKAVQADSQAIVSWNGPGPFKIVDDYVEASGENLLFGGADPAIPNLVPSDIEIRRNLFSKQLSWKSDDPTYAGRPWSVKNLLELKNARRVLIDGNIFQYNWPAAQNGFAILFTVRNQDGSAPWSAVQDVSFTNNVVQHVGSGINILGHDDLHTSQPAQRILIRNNFFTDVGGAWGDGRLFQILNGTANLVIDHNTAFQSDSFIVADGQPDSGFVFENNIVQNNLYGLIGTGAGIGTPSIRRYFPGAAFSGNVIVGGHASDYPPRNFFPGSPQAVGFTDTLHNNYRLTASSQFHGRATDGTDVGADFDALYSALTTSIEMPGTLPRAPRPRRPRIPLIPDIVLVQAALPFWPFVLLLGYAYLGYPLAIRARAARMHRTPGHGRIAGAEAPALRRIEDAARGAMDRSPVDRSPVERSPADRSPVDRSPVDRSPVDRSPVDRSSVDRSPVDRSPVDRSPVERGLQPARTDLPRVSFLVIAYNEGARIGSRIENLLQLDYPPDALEIVIASDGSTDDTVARARACEPAGVRTVAFDRRRGKPAVLNELVPRMHGSIVVLADARQTFERGALAALVAPFADPRVGAVSGELIIRSDRGVSGVGRGVGFYWRYEKFLRLHESRVDSTLGATGAIYAIRRALFEPIPDDTLLDDVVIPARIVRRGFRVLFEPGARAFDDPFGAASAEFARKTRTIAGTFQLFARERWLFSPRQNRIWLQTLSHKGLRLLLPVLHAGALVTNVELARSSPFYQTLLAGQMLFYAAAAGGVLTRRAKIRTPALTVPYAICLLNWATVVGFARFSTGRQRATWQKASETRSGRSARSAPPGRQPVQ